MPLHQLQSPRSKVGGRLVTGANANGQEKETSQESKEEGSAAQGEKAGEEASEEGEVRPEAGAQESIQEEDRYETTARKGNLRGTDWLPAQGARLLHGRGIRRHSGHFQPVRNRF